MYKPSKMNTGPILQVKYSQLAQDSIWFNTKKNKVGK